MFSLNHWFDRRNAIFPVSVSHGNNVLVFGLDCYLRLNWADVSPKKDSAPLYITDIRIDNRTVAQYGLCDCPVQEPETAETALQPEHTVDLLRHARLFHAVAHPLHLQGSKATTKTGKP